MLDFDLPVAAGPERRSIAGLGKPVTPGAFRILFAFHRSGRACMNAGWDRRPP
jgi:hypothetical protein